MSRNHEAIVSTALTWAVLLAGLAGLVACGKKEENPPPPAAEQAAAPVGPSQEAQIAAMLRGHPNSRRVCVDGNRERAFFLDYGPPLKPGEQDDGKMHGWYFIEKVDFYSTSNNTWFITAQEDRKYVTVYPDVAGLVCQLQGP
jgi:predicted small lipoprotein YifL